MPQIFASADISELHQLALKQVASGLEVRAFTGVERSAQRSGGAIAARHVHCAGFSNLTHPEQVQKEEIKAVLGSLVKETFAGK